MVLRTESQAQDVGPDVARPIRDPLLQRGAIIREERACGLLIAGQIARRRQHELVGGLLGGTFLLSRSPASPGVIHQPSQDGGCATWLRGQPAVVDGHITPPSGPGFGVEVDPALLSRIDASIDTG